jgi:hypothetical protein
LTWRFLCLKATWLVTRGKLIDIHAKLTSPIVSRESIRESYERSRSALGDDYYDTVAAGMAYALSLFPVSREESNEMGEQYRTALKVEEMVVKGADSSGPVRELINHFQRMKP